VEKLFNSASVLYDIKVGSVDCSIKTDLAACAKGDKIPKKEC